MIVGWDWAGESHDVSVVDNDGRLIEHWHFPHTERGLCETLDRLRQHGAPEEMPVAVELTTGLIVDRLLQAGHPVYPVHPQSFNAARPRWSSAKSKSDSADSFQLADYLRTDRARLHVLVPMALATRELRILSRSRDDQVEARKRAVRQLRATLEAYWPGPLQLFHRLDTQISLAFLERYPTSESAVGLGPARMQAFLRRNNYPGKWTAAELLERLRSAPVDVSGVDPCVVEALVLTQVHTIRALLTSIAQLGRSIDQALAKHPKRRVLESLPRVGSVNLAQILGEVGPVLDRAQTAEQVAAETGAVPVTRESGKGRGVSFRWTVNSRSRKALDRWVDNSRQSSPWAQEIYLRARRRGKRHPHAIRILTRAWLRVMWACWHSEIPYDPTRHGAIRRLNRENANAA